MAAPIISVVSNANIIAAQLQLRSAASSATVRGVVIQHAMLLQTRVKANASGRPGPNAPTGDYRRSIRRQTGSSTQAGGVTAEVGTDAPQGRRLEYGFTGVDSRGRYYDQQPYPHFGPALDATEKQFVDDLGDAVVRLMGGTAV